MLQTKDIPNTKLLRQKKNQGMGQCVSGKRKSYGKKACSLDVRQCIIQAKKHYDIKSTCVVLKTTMQNESVIAMNTMHHLIQYLPP